MTHSLMIAQQDVPPTLLEFPTHKAAEIAARELRINSGSLQIINNSSGKVTNFSAVLEAEAREEEELSAARYQARIDSLPDKEIRRICAQHEEELDRWNRRRRVGEWPSRVPHLDYAVKRRMDEIKEQDKLERQWIEAVERMCGIHEEPVNTCDAAPSASVFDVSREVDMSRAEDNSLALFCLWGGLMLIAAAAVYAVG